MTTSGDPGIGPRLDRPDWSEDVPEGHVVSPDQHPTPEAASFKISRRGYDRPQVDTRIRVLLSELATTEAAWQRESQRAAWAEHELRAAMTKLSQDPNTPEGFGHQVQRLLALAEEEAAGVRAAATTEAAAILERARADAEARRRATEQADLARDAARAQEVERRKAQLAERERQLTEQLGSVQEQAAQIRAAAERDAERLRLDAEARAEELRNRSGRVIHQLHEMADQQLRRARSPYEAIRHELTRLYELLDGVGRPGSPGVDLMQPRHQADPYYPDPLFSTEHRDPYGETADALLQATSDGGTTDEDGSRGFASAG